jgi:hypothetical protein
MSGRLQDAVSAFAQTYAEARGKFLSAADAAGLPVHSHGHPLRGRDGETLAMDIVREGSADATRVLLITSACHGVEGFCGSGVQVHLLRDSGFRALAAARGVAVVQVHALNPHGFSGWRRTTHENVDLNRNFHDFSRPLPENPGYDELATALVPAHWPPRPDDEARLAAYAVRHGAFGLQTAVSSGQYRYPDGIFFGGVAPTWSHETFRQVLREHGRRCERLAWIDLHTGLGPSGVGERIFAGRGDPVALARAKAWWGSGVTSVDDGSSTSAPLEGLMWTAGPAECPQAEITGIALEFGTLPLNDVMAALRADQWLHNHPDTDDSTRQAIQRQIRDAFYVDTDEWKQAIVDQGREAAEQAISGLIG